MKVKIKNQLQKILKERKINDNKILLESILDPVHVELNDSIWQDEKLIGKVRDEILEIIYTWLKTNGLDKRLFGINFMGSNTGYQYSTVSDIDINVKLDIDTESNEYWELVQQLPNGNLLSGTEHPINYYIVDKDWVMNPELKGSMYDVLKQSWVFKPDKSKIKIPFLYIIETAKVFMKGIDDRIIEYNNDIIERDLYEEYLKYEELTESEQGDLEKMIEYKEHEIMGDLDGIKVLSNLIHTFRAKSFEEDATESVFFFDDELGNYSIPNQIYKILEKFGYNDKIQKYIEIRKEKLRQVDTNTNTKIKTDKEITKKESKKIKEEYSTSFQGKHNYLKTLDIYHNFNIKELYQIESYRRDKNARIIYDIEQDILLTSDGEKTTHNEMLNVLQTDDDSKFNYLTENNVLKMMLVDKQLRIVKGIIPKQVKQQLQNNKTVKILNLEL